MNRRGFLVGLVGVGIVPPWRPPPARPVVTWPVYATLVGSTKWGEPVRSEPVVFDSRWAVPPLRFRAPRAGTWTHVEMTDGERVKLQELFPSVATWSEDDLVIGGTTWE